ncbi:MAG: O-antigen ligase family protein [Alteraurantiacibacter sp.]
MADATAARGVAFFSPLKQLQALVLLALLLGGGGLAYGLRNLAIQLLALALIATNWSLVARFLSSAPRPLAVLVGLSLALPLVQLVPLPPALWQALPGREVVAESFAILGMNGRWFPASLDPMRTLVAFCGTLAPAALIVVGSQLSANDTQRLLHTALAGCGIAFLLGAVQLASANSVALLYAERTQPDVLYATFANRNSTAMLFVLALALLSSGVRLPGGCWTSLAVGVLLALGVVLTQSRSGMALLVPVLLFTLWRFSGVSDRKVVLSGLAVLLAGAATAWAASDRINGALERFSTGAADRPEMWEDSAYAAREYWPVGSGMGTFDEVFQLHESLEYVSPRKAGRAHSDWLEITIEGGIVSLVLALGWLTWIASAALRTGSPDTLWHRRAAGLALSCIALQSLVDYPLRNQSLLCMAALCVALLVTPRVAR